MVQRIHRRWLVVYALCDYSMGRGERRGGEDREMGCGGGDEEEKKTEGRILPISQSPPSSPLRLVHKRWTKRDIISGPL